MEEKDRKFIRMIGVLSTVGITMVVATVIGFYIGYWLDTKLGTKPWLMLVFLLLGIAAGFKNLFDQVKKIQDFDDSAKGQK